MCCISHCQCCLFQLSADIEEEVDKEEEEEEVKEGGGRKLPSSRKRRERCRSLGKSRAYSGVVHVSLM